MPIQMHPNALDLTGHRSGKLVAIEPVERQLGYIMWKCKCDCGGESIVRSSCLKREQIKSCGCEKKPPPHASGAENSNWKGGLCVRSTIKVECPECHKERAVRIDHFSRDGTTKYCLSCSARRISKSHSGENHWHWRGGISSERDIITGTPEYIQWRSSVLQRDGHHCSICGSNGNLVAHHLASFDENPDLRTDVNNGLTLCEDCHKLFHHEYGYGENTLTQMYNFCRRIEDAIDEMYI